MPRRKPEPDSEVFVNNAKKRTGGQKPRIAAGGHKLPEPLPNGMVVTDVMKHKWKLGKSIGFGGFGEIYLASDEVDKPIGLDAPYVMKIEHHNNGPLFAEMHFYHRVGKEDLIQEWVRKKKLDYLGMPRFVASGSHEFKNIKYRFMVMDRFGEDLQKILNRSKNILETKTVFTLAIRILDILEYIHSFGYIHADVKASNLLLGYGQKHQVYLIDFGLACRFMVDGKHKEYKEDLRKAHDGTIEFTSRDAHIGAHSRRGDLEILGYNLLQWLSGRLPWEDNLKDPEYVSHQKAGFLSNVPLLMNKCFPGHTYPETISVFLQYIGQLKFEDEPNYNYCRSLFKNAIKKLKYKDDMKLQFTPSPAKGKKRTKASQLDDDDDDCSPNEAKGRRKAEKDKKDDSEDDESKHSSSLENPTPAMLLVMQRRLEIQQQQKEERKKNARARNRAKDISKEEVVKKYKEKRNSPDEFETKSNETSNKRLPRSLAAKGAVHSRRTPLATCSTQSPGNSKRNSYSPEL